MVESQQDQDDGQDYGTLDDDDGELPPYLTSDYLDQCDLYNCAEEAENITRGSPASSTYSRPVSR